MSSVREARDHRDDQDAQDHRGQVGLDAEPGDGDGAADECRDLRAADAEAMRLMTGNGTPVLSPMKPEKLSSTKSRTAPKPRASRICQPPRPRAKRPMANA